MIQHLSAIELGTVANRGAGLTVSAKQFSAIDLGTIANKLRGSAVLHVVDSALLTAIEIGTIANRAHEPAYVMFS